MTRKAEGRSSGARVDTDGIPAARLHIPADGIATGSCITHGATQPATGLTPRAAAVPVRYLPSPNCDERAAGTRIELLVIHAISLPPGQFGGPGIEDLFLNRLDPAGNSYYAAIADLRVSAHFLVRRDGALLQFVPCVKRAWHAGISSWRGRSGCNDFAVGIELEGADDIPFESAQYGTLEALTRALRASYPIIDITGHSDIAPGRKTDPGPFFDWRRYRAALDAESGNVPG